MAKITKTSMISGRVNMLNIPSLSQEEFDKRYAAWERKEYMIQEAFPMLSVDQREFIMTGITPAEWDMYMKPEEEE